MKKTLFTLYILFICCVSFAQNSIQYSVKWNTTQNRYEVYAKPSFTQSNFAWGTSQVGIVTPSSAPDAITVTSSAIPGWSVGQTIILAPAAQPTSDFFGVSTTGGTVNLVANSEIMLFSFVFQSSQCSNGVRLYITGSDPTSNAAGMNGGDFRSYVYDDNGTQHFQSNYNNTGTQCNPCNITAPELSKQ